MGNTVPHISNLRALPTPGDSIWPQAVFDLDYSGGACTSVSGLMPLWCTCQPWPPEKAAVRRWGQPLQSFTFAAACWTMNSHSLLHAPDKCWRFCSQDTQDTG